MSYISLRGQKSITDFDTGIPDIYENVYDAQTNPSGVISLALSENVSASSSRKSRSITSLPPDTLLIQVKLASDTWTAYGVHE